MKRFFALVGGILAMSAVLGAPALASPPPKLVKDIHPGAAGSKPNDLVAIGKKVYFTASDGVHGVELWRSSGKAAGTKMVADINPGAKSSSPNQLTVVGGKLLFKASDGVHGTELWSSDGTAAGTHLARDIHAGPKGSNPDWLTASGGLLYFSAADGVHGNELWRSNGTAAGTKLVKDIAPGSTPSYPTWLTSVGGALFFFPAPDGGATPASFQLWRSDGTAAGTVLVSGPLQGGETTSFNGRLFFDSNLEPSSGFWSSDGTGPGTTLLHPGAVFTECFAQLAGKLYVGASTYGPPGTFNEELWRTDGTPAGTQVVKQIDPADSMGGNPEQMVRLGSLLILEAEDPLHGQELWRSDGTAVGTTIVKDIRSGTSGSDPGNSDPGGLAPVGSRVYFQANDGTHGAELWASNGSAAGTKLVKDIRPGAGGSAPSGLVNAAGRLFFAANDGGHGTELWKLVP